MPGTQIKVFDKIVQVIELLATSHSGATLKDVQQALGLNKGTAFRILRTLEAHGVAARNGHGTFVLGSRIPWWESCRRQNLDFSKIVRPHLERLRVLTSETVVFSVLTENRTVVAEQAASHHATSTRFELGLSAPLHAGATGRVILAHLDPGKRKQILSGARLERLTKLTITDKKKLEQVLGKCRAQGFALSEGERFLTTSSLAAPIFGAQNEVLGAISVSGPSDRLTRQKCKTMVSLLLREPRLLTARFQSSNLGEQRTSVPVGTGKAKTGSPIKPHFEGGR